MQVLLMKLDFFYCFYKFLVIFGFTEQIDDLLQIAFRIGIRSQCLAHKKHCFQLTLAQQKIFPPGT